MGEGGGVNEVLNAFSTIVRLVFSVIQGLKEN